MTNSKLLSFLICCAIAIAAAATPAARAAGDYSLSTGMLPFNFVSGDSVEIIVAGPSQALARKAVIKLNGKDVSSAVKPNGTGALSGNLSGLTGGENIIDLFAAKGAKTPAAELKVWRGISPKIDCVSMKGRTVDASAIGLPTKGATITDAKLVPATSVQPPPAPYAPEYCAISGVIASVDPTASNINFQIDIPTIWSEKSFHEGGGGDDGSIPGQVANPVRSPFATAIPGSPSVLAEGYAIYGSDSGHQSRFGRGGPPGARGAGGPPLGRGAGGLGGQQPGSAPNGTPAPANAGGAPGRGAGGFAPDPAAAAAENAWVVNQESWMNFAYQQIKKTHDVAMQIELDMYGTKSKVTYFIGTSQGGREGLEALSRYPDDYDGVLSQVPLAYFAGLLFDPTMQGISQLAPGTWVPPAKAPAIAAEILRQCDSLDGIEDGVISNYLACDRKLDPAITPNPLANIRCPNGEDTGNDCLSDKQIATVNSFHTAEHFGYPMANGESDWPGWGTGIEGNAGAFGWLLSATQPDVNNPSTFNGGIGAAVQKGRFGGSPDFNLLTLKFAGFQKQIQALSDQLDVREDWSGFFKRKGKLIWVSGASDYISNPRAQMRLYDRVVAHSGQATVDQYVRYYVSPNVGHGLNGTSASRQPVPNLEDTLHYLQEWVENGNPPPDPVTQSLYSTQRPGGDVISEGPVAQRPLCRYPKYPRYNGSGDAKSASSYTCTAP